MACTHGLCGGGGAFLGLAFGSIGSQLEAVDIVAGAVGGASEEDTTDIAILGQPTCTPVSDIPVGPACTPATDF